MIEISLQEYDSNTGCSRVQGQLNVSCFKELLLNSTSFYDVGIDQSHSCTGVYIEEVGSDSFILMELVNNMLDKYTYRRALLNAFRRLLRGIHIRYLVMEDPLKWCSGHQNRALLELKNQLVELFESDSSKFSIEHFDKIQPQVWRAGLLPKGIKFYKNGNGEEVQLDRRSKEATAFTIMHEIPETKKFLKVCYNPTNASGYDGYDACGVLRGYKLRHGITDDNGEVTKILGAKNTSSQALGIFFPCRTKEEMNTFEAFAKFLSDKNYGNLGEPTIKIYNSDESVVANAKMALANNTRFTVTKIDDSNAIVSLMIRFNWVGTILENLIMVVLPCKKIKKEIFNTIINCNLPYMIFY